MSDPLAAPSRRIRAFGWIAIFCVVALAVPALSALTTEATYPPMAPAPPALAPLTHRAVLVLVDGLRYDYATNPELAPHFARNMQRHSNAEVWAGRITMTSAAVLALGTGTRGSFSQVVLNVDARRTQANHLFANLHARGLTSGLIGDPIWKSAYGDFDVERTSPGDLALDVDDSPELFEHAHGRIARGELPGFLVVHFFANDHQQHAHGVFSKKFSEFFARFDRNLDDFLEALPKDTTVLVLSDHGALTNGNHGVDSDLERKTPLFAYGPGIRDGQRLVLEQVDIAPTLATLLGIASPAHSVGVPATALLDIDDASAKRLACFEATRVAGLAHAGGDLTAFDSTQCDVQKATNFIRDTDRRIAEASARSGTRGLGWAFAILLVFGAIVPLSRKASFAARSALAFVATAAACIAITSFVDRSLPPWNDSRAVIAWLGTLAIAACAFFPPLAERWISRTPWIALALAPGFFFASFPTNTQVHAGLVATIALAAAALGAWRAQRSARELLPALIAGATGVAVALRIATVRDDPLGAIVAQREWTLGPALVAVWLIFAALYTEGERLGRRRRTVELVAALALVALSGIRQSLIPAPVGFGALVLLPAIAILSVRRGSMILARAALFATYALVSRPIEIPAVAGAALAAEAIGVLIARSLANRSLRANLSWAVPLAAASAFALAYSARVGIQRGLDFATMDWGAGTFDSSVNPPSRVAVALVIKYVFALLIASIPLFAALPDRIRRPALRLTLALCLLRLGTMVGLLFGPGVSFWSRFRMVGELGPVAILCVLAAGALLVVERATARVAQPDFAPSASAS